MDIIRNSNARTRHFLIQGEFLRIRDSISAYPLALFDEHWDLQLTTKSTLLNVFKTLYRDPTSSFCGPSSHRVLIPDGIFLLLLDGT